MRTLTDVFTPGAPTIPEGLRTLAVSPERELEPGMTVRATFTFRNQGGATATGVRVKMNLPEGLVYLVGSGQLDGTLLDDEQGNSPLLARAGADIGDVAAGQERRIDIAYSVAGAIENGSTVELQAAVAAFELPPAGSNIVRLVARSRPALENALTNVTIEARQQEPRPGGEATISVRVHNAGESSAHDVVVVAPVPENTSYIPNSVRLNGREFERELHARFDQIYAPVIVPALPASATATLTYRVRIDEPLADGTPITARAHVASQETPAFELAPAALTVRARADFEGERTAFSVEPSKDVAPGSHVRLHLHAYNAGTTAAQNVGLAIALPEGLVPVRGTTAIDGAPVRDRKKESAAFDLGVIGAGAELDFVTEVTVLSPFSGNPSVPIRAVLRWDTGEREFHDTVAVSARPYLNARRNSVERSGAMLARPGEECEAAIAIVNDGSAPATDAVLHVVTDAGLEDVRAFEKSARLTIENESIELGTIEAYGTRRIAVRARVRTPCADRSELHLSAALHCQELGETRIGQVCWRVDSHPAFTPQTSGLSLVQDDVFRPNQLVDVYVRLRNDGTDVAQNVRLRLYVSPDARLETVEGATRERSALLFGEIAPGAAAEARLGVRLLRSLAKAHPVTIESVLSADAMLPVQLARVTIVTAAEPNFAIGTLRSIPDELVDVGEELEFVLHVRNSGDGPARSVRISVPQLDSLIYVPNSTAVNDLPVRDVGAQSPLTSPRGLVMTDVDPGIEATVRWREVVHNGLSSGETIVRVATIAYDAERSDEIAAPELKVRTSPAFANSISGLPFGVDGMLGPSFAGSAHRALPPADDRFVELPPATPVTRGEFAASPVLSLAPSSNGNGHMHEAVQGEVENGAERVQFAVAYDRDRLDRTIRFLGETKFGGLVGHLFAIRAFFPDAMSVADTAALSEVREGLRETLDRLFIKLRLPNYVLAPRDLETPASRAALEALLDAMQPSAQTLDPAGTTVLHGSTDRARMRALRERLTSCGLATALPWAIVARLIPDEGEALAHYRGMLIATLEDLAGVDETAFIDALQRRPYPVLDAALEIVRAQFTAIRA
ncbi:MAG TPA: hypothetical protein VFA29_05690 [Candidatus Baltobacteraceae bacterium]|nr:hypothetical protein [Candidatus Baltobacteraceae bacterium]